MPNPRSPAVRNVPIVVGGALLGAQLARTLRSRLALGARRAEPSPPTDPGVRKGGRVRSHGPAWPHPVSPPESEAGEPADDADLAGDLRIRAPVHPPGQPSTDALEAPPIDPAEMAVSAGLIPSEPVSMQESELQLALAQAQEVGWPEAAPAKQSRGAFAIAKDAVMAWFDDGGPRLGASIAFYTLFALAPLMLVLLAIAGAVFGEEAARGQILEQIGGLVGSDAAKSIQDIIASADKKNAQGAFGTIVGLVTALIGASAVFVEMKNAFDTIFKPQQKEKSAVTAFVRARLMSVALVLAIAFLVVVSLLLSAATAALIQWLASKMPFLEPVLGVVDVVVTTAVLTVAFWVLIRYLPEQAPKSSAVWIGALTAALLFAVGKRLISLYLAHGAVASAYGAAGSLIVVVLWVYYSAQILLLGAEVSRAIDDPAKAADKADGGREPVAAQ